MKAAVFYGPGRFVVEERPEPEPRANQVLVRVEYAGICGTDLHHAEAPPYKVPPEGVIMGHEFSGQIAGVGSDVDSSRIGENVVVLHLLPCYQCDSCQRGLMNLCLRPNEKVGLGTLPGGFAEYVAVEQTMAVPLGEFDARAGSLVEPLAVAYHAVALSGIGEGDSALVTGCGPIGLLLLVVLRHMGAGPLIASEVSPYRREEVRRIGVEHAFDPLEADLDEEVRGIVGPLGIGYAFECSGNPTAFRQALELLRPAGTMMVVGFGDREVTISARTIQATQLRVIGSRAYNDYYDAALDLMSNGLDLPDIISAERPLEDLERSIKELGSGSDLSKVVIRPSM
ncbi:MAG: alcohol dehydrogenase catalytic domain-containing protein [Dehalococcoidia bacterium]|nr:alcohol dehydrogenase catalytic domain-containing protein [Dehalococcoidia bacterium]